MKQIRKINSFFFKAILSVAAVLTLVAANSAPASAQQKSEAKPPKTRDISIYVYDARTEGEPFLDRLVPVRRTILNNKPLSRALKMLTKGVTEEEQERNQIGVAYDFRLVSARIRNRTAQINFKVVHEETIQESWEGSGFRYEDFVKAVELTAKQFPALEYTKHSDAAGFV